MQTEADYRSLLRSVRLLKCGAGVLALVALALLVFVLDQARERAEDDSITASFGGLKVGDLDVETIHLRERGAPHDAMVARVDAEAGGELLFYYPTILYDPSREIPLPVGVRVHPRGLEIFSLDGARLAALTAGDAPTSEGAVLEMGGRGPASARIRLATSLDGSAQLTLQAADHAGRVTIRSGGPANDSEILVTGGPGERASVRIRVDAKGRGGISITNEAGETIWTAPE